MSEAAKALGMAQPIIFEGKEYPVTPFDLGMFAVVEGRLERNLWLAVSRSKGVGTPEDYRLRIDVAEEKINAGELKYGSTAAAKFAASLEGRKFLLYLQLKVQNPEVTEGLVERMFAADMELILAQLRTAAFDPNPKPPGQDAPGDGPGTSSSAT
jgi:hypothetical protein